MAESPEQLVLALAGSGRPVPGVLLPSAEALGLMPTDGQNPEASLRAARAANYAQSAAKAMDPPDAAMKALAPVPSAFSFSTMAYMPDPLAGGLISWPGIPPESLQKLARTNLAPEMIISTRVSDVLRYAGRSSHPWKPGWRVEMVEKSRTPSTHDRRDIRACESMLEACNIELDPYQPRKRDAAGYPSFRRFIAAAVRDFMTYDAMAVWTDMDSAGRIRGWSNLPAGNIRMADPAVGYQGLKSDFAVLVDQTGTVRRPFKRDELIWHVGNPRPEPDVGLYGWSRLDAAMTVIAAFQDAFDLNRDVFSKSSTPNGMLLLKGMGFTQDDLDAIARTFQNLKKGVSKTWALPAMVVPKDSDVEFLDISADKDRDIRYQNHMNMVMGVFCLFYQFPHRRLGFRISGNGPDSQPVLPTNGQASPADEEDTGLITLLGHIEFVLNNYLIWTRFPHLQMTFCGKAPREDAREYEAKNLARTWGERRAEADLPSLEDLVSDPDLKKVAEVLSMAPTDPGLATIFSAVAVKMLGINPADAGGEQPQFGASGDPAKAEDHGATAGVRRHSPRAHEGG